MYLTIELLQKKKKYVYIGGQKLFCFSTFPTKLLYDQFHDYFYYQ